MKKTIKLRLITAAVGLAMAAGMVYAAGNQKAGAARKAKPGFTKVKLMTGQKKKITIKNKAKKAVYIYRSSARLLIRLKPVRKPLLVLLYERVGHSEYLWC